MKVDEWKKDERRRPRREERREMVGCERVVM